MIHDPRLVPLEQHEPVEELDDDFFEDIAPEHLDSKKKTFLFVAS